MSDKHFQVVLSGKLAEGMTPEQVKANVAALFKVGVDKVEKLFNGRPVVIKKGLDASSAQKYQMALQRAGALCQVVDTSPPAAETPPPASDAPIVPDAAANGEVPQDDIIPTIDSGLHKSVVKQAPLALGSLEGVQIDEPGVILVKPQEIEEPKLDLSGLSMDEPGVTLIEPEEAQEALVDISGLSMDEPGVTLVEPQEVEGPQVDLSGLSMDEPGVTLVEPQEPEEPEIDTSKFSLD